MTNYLNKKIDYLQSDITNTCDELQLWSSPFGLLLLENFPIRDYSHYLDIGCGTGFPLIEVAQRLGHKCTSVGLDQWAEAVKRTATKINTLQLENISVIEGDASTVPFHNQHFDLITSNLGINNFDHPDKVLSECHRVLKPTGSLCLTTNLTGTFTEFYEVYRETLYELGFEKYLAPFTEHVNHRGTEASVTELLDTNDFKIRKIVRSTYSMRFLNGSAFLNHSFIIMAFLGSWKNLFDEKDKHIFFERFEKNLNTLAGSKGEFKLTILMLYLECVKK